MHGESGCMTEAAHCEVDHSVPQIDDTMNDVDYRDEEEMEYESWDTLTMIANHKDDFYYIDSALEESEKRLRSGEEDEPFEGRKIPASSCSTGLWTGNVISV